MYICIFHDLFLSTNTLFSSWLLYQIVGFFRSEMASQRPQIVKRELKMSNPTNKLIFVLDNVFTPEECDDYIKKTESMGYVQALVNVGGK